MLEAKTTVKNIIQKFKFDQYCVFAKKRKYDVIVFPNFENAWAFLDWDEERCMIDGDKELFETLRIAMAILIADPSKILYFPIKKVGVTRYQAADTFHAVLMRTELQFRRSEWYDLKSQLDRKHWVGKYTIKYDCKKLQDYFNVLYDKHYYDKWAPAFKNIVDEVLGDTVFLVLPEVVCYDYHSDIVETLKTYSKNIYDGTSAEIGYIIPDNICEEFAEEDKRIQFAYNSAYKRENEH